MWNDSHRQSMMKKQMNTAHNIKVETDMMCNKFSSSLCILTQRKIIEYKNHLVNDHKKEHNQMVKQIKAEFSCDECQIVYPCRSMLSSYLDSGYSGHKVDIPLAEINANNFTEAKTKEWDDMKVHEKESENNV